MIYVFGRVWKLSMFCKECGRNIGEAEMCPYCRTKQKTTEYFDFYDFDSLKIKSTGKRSRLTAAFLQIFLGAVGIGRFYMGYKKIALLQIVVTFCTFGIGGFIWGLIDGILILTGNERLDADGKFLR